jgi:hypothetical protein
MAIDAMYAAPTDQAAKQKLVRQLIRDKSELEGDIYKLMAEVETEKTLREEAIQELEAGGRVVELEAELVELRNELETTTGKKQVKKLRLRSIEPLVNVRALQTERDALVIHVQEVTLERDALAKKIGRNNEEIDACYDEIFGYKERLKKLSPLYKDKDKDKAGGVVDGTEEKDAAAAKKKRRLFCHICELFEVHDTLDCPKAGGGGGSKFSTPKTAVAGIARPYCEVCEEFGHATDDCNVGLDDDDDDHNAGGGDEDDDFY